MTVVSSGPATGARGYRATASDSRKSYHSRMEPREAQVAYLAAQRNGVTQYGPITELQAIADAINSAREMRSMGKPFEDVNSITVASFLGHVKERNLGIDDFID